jgi:predicted nucleic acid-binding protein
MPRFVLDNSLTMAWYFEDEATPFADEVLDGLTLDSEAFVPPLWALEVTNVLLVGERRGRTTTMEEEEFLALLQRLPIAIIDTARPRIFDEVLPIARQQQLSSYDALYLDLAQREGLPLASLDNRLREAARRVGVVLLDEV